MRTLTKMTVMTVEVKGTEYISFSCIYLQLGFVQILFTRVVLQIFPFNLKELSKTFMIILQPCHFIDKTFSISILRSIKFLNDWLQSMDYDVNFLWHNITVSSFCWRVKFLAPGILFRAFSQLIQTSRKVCQKKLAAGVVRKIHVA